MLHYRLHHDPTSSHQQLARLVRRMARGPVLDVTAVACNIGPLPYGRGSDTSRQVRDVSDEWRLAQDVMAARHYPVMRDLYTRTGTTL